MVEAKANKAAIKKVRPALIRNLAPSDRKYVALKLELLVSRYGDNDECPDPDRNPNGYKLYMTVKKNIQKEWIDDLKFLPPDLLDKACKNWRMKDTGFAPRSAGQLVASVNAEYAERNRALSNCDKITELLARGNYQ